VSSYDFYLIPWRGERFYYTKSCIDWVNGRQLKINGLNRQVAAFGTKSMAVSVVISHSLSFSAQVAHHQDGPALDHCRTGSTEILYHRC
jgi:hypothetical protein